MSHIDSSNSRGVYLYEIENQKHLNQAISKRQSNIAKMQSGDQDFAKQQQARLAPGQLLSSSGVPVTLEKTVTEAVRAEHLEMQHAVEKHRLQ